MAYRIVTKCCIGTVRAHVIFAKTRIEGVLARIDHRDRCSIFGLTVSRGCELPRMRPKAMLGRWWYMEDLWCASDSNRT
jgi:hypothetical protein